MATGSPNKAEFASQLRGRVRDLEARYSVAFEAFKTKQAWASVLAGIGVKALYEADLATGLPSDTIKRARRAWQNTPEYLRFRNEVDDLAREADRAAHSVLGRSPSFREVHRAIRPETKLARLAGVLDIIESAAAQPASRRTNSRRGRASVRNRPTTDLYLAIVGVSVASYFGIVSTLPQDSPISIRAVVAMIGALVIDAMVLVSYWYVQRRG